MVKVKSIITLSIFLLLLGLFFAMASSEGRMLSYTEKTSSSNRTVLSGSLLEGIINYNDTTSVTNRHTGTNQDQSVETVANDFRPTTPGHSPGVGHANGPSSSGPDN